MNGRKRLGGLVGRFDCWTICSIISSSLLAYCTFSSFALSENYATPLFEQRDEITQNHKSTKIIRRLDIQCCGVGDRLVLMAAAAMINEGREDTSTAVHWGPCSNHSKNVFGEIFKPVQKIVPFQPLDGDPPYPEIGQYGTMLEGIASKVKSSYDELPSAVKHNLCDLLSHGFTSEYMLKVEAFKSNHQWESSPVIGLHIRTGNSFDPTNKYSKEIEHIHGRVGGVLQKRLGLEGALQVYINHVVELAKEMGLSQNFRVFVVGDSPVIFEILQNITRVKQINWFHREQSYHPTAHPLVYANLRSNNAGDKCQLSWFSEPIIDLHLLASTAALVTSMSSGFYLLAEKCLQMQNRTVCHCSRENGNPETCSCTFSGNVVVNTI